MKCNWLSMVAVLSVTSQVVICSESMDVYLSSFAFPVVVVDTECVDHMSTDDPDRRREA